MQINSRTVPPLAASSRAGLRRATIVSGALAATILSGCTVSSPSPPPVESKESPNILMILLDDLGYTDLGAYGGDANTSNIDALADEGVMFSNFHAYAVCAPTRASLMTGQDPHRVGLGSMEGITPPGVALTTPGYRGSLEGSYHGIAEVLSGSGYTTFQVGKWHLGRQPEQTPQALGFDQNFTLYEGAASHYADSLRIIPAPNPPTETVVYERNGQAVTDLPEDFYSTYAYTDEMSQLITEAAEDDKPFFGYLAYTAPHDPLHTPRQDLIDEYLDLYLGNSNYDSLRESRIDTLVAAGLLDDEVATRWPDQVPRWGELSTGQREDLAYRLATYAAMIQDVDEQVGLLIEQLKELDEFDNTLIVIASDNGAAGPTRAFYSSFAPGWLDQHYPSSGDPTLYGQEKTFASLGLPNAQVSSGPLFHSKFTVFEGGTRVPAIVKLPNDDAHRGEIVDSFVHISDLYPTFADYAGADIPDQPELLGATLRDVFEGGDSGRDEFGMEWAGQRAYREGDWKLVYAPASLGGTGDWALYDLAADLGETTDVSAKHPDVVTRLAGKWDTYAKNNGVSPAAMEDVNAAQNPADPLFVVDWAE